VTETLALERPQTAAHLTSMAATWFQVKVALEAVLMAKPPLA
jgi:hypothetical protein